MAKKIKFPLTMKDGITVRTIEELRDNFDLKKVLEYYNNGKLQIWLEDRYYIKELGELRNIGQQENSLKLICDIFQIPFDGSEKVNIEELNENGEKLEQLRQLTDDEDILSNIDKIAFNQEEMLELVRCNEKTVYLCNVRFNISENIKEIKFFGIGKAEAIIVGANYEDLQKRGVIFQNITLLDETGEALITVRLEDAEQLYMTYHIEAALPLLKQLSDMGNGRAQFMLGIIYDDGAGNIQRDQSEAIRYFALGSENGDILCKFRQAIKSQEGLQPIYDELLEPMKEEAQSNNALAVYELGLYYLQDYSNKNLELLAENSKKAAEKGYWRAWETCGINYEFGRGVEVDYLEAKKYYLKAAEAGIRSSQLKLGELLYGKTKEIKEGIKWLKLAYTVEQYDQEVKNLILMPDKMKQYTFGVDLNSNCYQLDNERRSSANAVEMYVRQQLEKYCEENSKQLGTNAKGYNDLKNYYINYIEKFMDKLLKLTLLALDIQEIEGHYQEFMDILSTMHLEMDEEFSSILSKYSRYDASDYCFGSAAQKSPVYNGLFGSADYYIESEYICQYSRMQLEDNAISRGNKFAKEIYQDVSEQIKGIIKDAQFNLHLLKL